MIKRITALVIITILIITGGCSLNDNQQQTTTAPYVLTDRQIAALEDVGLPTDYEALDMTQKYAIIRIEEGLSYLDNKYGERFIYAGYIRPSILDKETLFAVQEKDPIGVVELIYPRKGEDDSIYEDDFMTYVVEPIYDARMLDYFKSQLGDIPFFADIYISDTVYQHPDEVPKDINAIDGKIGARIALFLDGGKMGEAEYDAFIENYKAWCLEHKMETSLEIGLIKPGYIQKMTPDYYTTYRTEEYRIRYDRMYLGE